MNERAEEAGGWQHLHPLSPLLRGGLAFVAVVGYVLSQQTDRLFGQDAQDPTGGHWVVAALAVLLVLGLIVAGAWVSWRVSRFRVGSSMLELRTGLVFRQHRQVPFDRIQAVDISRPILAQLTGLSEVIVQSAGGRDSNIKLSFLTDARARELREQLMALAGRPDEAAPLSVVAGSATESTAALRPPLVVVPNARLVQSALYSGTGVVILVGVPLLALAFLAGVPGVLAWLGPLALGVGGRQLQGLLRNANFTLHHQGDRLLVRRGLTDLRSTSVPLHRIQAAELVQPWFWRVPGWWRLRVNVAGVGSRDEDTETLLLPVGTLDEALAVLALVRPGIPRELALVALMGEGTAHGFTTASARARLIDPLSWSRRGYAVTPDCLLVRGGALQRVAQVVPHARIQSLRLEQGPVQRRRGVASVRLVSTPGPVRPEAAHLDVAEAVRLVNEQIARSSRARRRV